MNTIARKAMLAAAVCVSAAMSTVSAEVNFAVGRPVGAAAEDPAVYETLVKKTEQILTRTNAGAAGALDVFVVRPMLTVGETASTEGLVRNVNTLGGEFTLTALNAIDGSTYHSVTVPLNVVVKGDGVPEALLLARSVKTTDAAFVRFIRQTRERVEAYYTEHCSEVVARAQALASAGHTALAQIYLLGVPASAPCYDEVVSLIADFEARKNPPVAPEPAVAEEAPASPQPDPCPEAGQTPEVAPADPSGQAPKIYVSNPQLKIKFDGAVYDAGSRQIKIAMRAIYDGERNLNGAGIYFSNALSPDGHSYSARRVVGDTFVDLPVEVPVKLQFVINDVRANPGKLPYCEFKISGIVVEVRDIQVR